MPITNFPNGFDYGVNLRGMPILTAHGGNVFWVDSVGGANTGDGTFDYPYSTIDYAVGRCTASNGDIIMVKPGHTETVSAAAGLDLDVAGITIWFLGNGNDRGSVTFGTATTADMDVDAADITIINPRFVAAIDALAGPIDVNAARFRMVNATWQDGTTINTTDVLVADANADDMTIDGFEFIDGDAAGTQKQSFIQIAGATRPTLRNIRCTGDFGTGIVENGTAWVDATLEDLVLDNASASPTVCVLLQATSTGWMRNSALRVASGTTGYTANNDMQFDNVSVVGTDAMGTGADVVGTKGDSAATGAVTTTDTAMSYVKQLVTQNGSELDTDTLGAILVGSAGIATFPSGAAAANGVSLAEVLRYAQENIINGAGTTLPSGASLWGAIAGATGVPTWPAAAAPADAVSIAEALRYVSEQQSIRYVTRAASVLSNGLDLFTVTGTIAIKYLYLLCATGNDATASTIQFNAVPTVGSATTISAASASVANAAAGATVTLAGTALATAALYAANGPNLIANPGTILVPAGVIDVVVGVGSTTGTWSAHLVYEPLSAGASVAAA